MARGVLREPEERGDGVRAPSPTAAGLLEKPAGSRETKQAMTPRYMLDTDVLSLLMRAESVVVEHLESLQRSAVCMSSISLGELQMGAELKRSNRLHAQIDRVV